MRLLLMSGINSSGVTVAPPSARHPVILYAMSQSAATPTQCTLYGPPQTGDRIFLCRRLADNVLTRNSRRQETALRPTSRQGDGYCRQYTIQVAVVVGSVVSHAYACGSN